MVKGHLIGCVGTVFSTCFVILFLCLCECYCVSVQDCMYLHELGEDEASFTKEDMQLG